MANTISDPPVRSITDAESGQVTATSSRVLRRLGITVLVNRGVRPLSRRRSRR